MGCLIVPAVSMYWVCGSEIQRMLKKMQYPRGSRARSVMKRDYNIVS